MGKLIYSMGLSLDGYIAGPNGELEWSAPDEELHRHKAIVPPNRLIAAARGG